MGEATLDRGLIVLPQGKLVDPDTPTWNSFANSWADLPRDTWMADGGTYRRRRYAAYEVADGQCTRLPHRPHFQDRGYNPLNGGVERWFAPIEQDQPWLPMLATLIHDTAAAIARASGREPHAWSVEAHQFRIEALSGHPGLPTPEGMHRDGRDWVLILLVGGSNYAGGESRVEDADGACLLEHRLAQPGEALLLNDREVRHGTTPIEAVIPGVPAWRDTLVLTFAMIGCAEGG
ncbi:2OG-Fe dioxygenase family protein [Aurantiacibacter xanthus]|nr:2OG-Fe dioxygenase family protein [Aurantiacibacter xanthus]